MVNNVIEVNDVTKVYKTKKKEIIANKDINFIVKKGEIIGILGPNGVGKSTLIKQIIGYTSPTNGSIKVLGHDVDSINKCL